MADYIVHKAVEIDSLSNKQLQALAEHSGWVVMPKYDGCHAVICFDDGVHVNTYSRTGETVHSLNHIARALPDHYDFLKNGQWAICGEAWNPGLEFNEISGQFRRHDPNATDLYFVPFDVVPWGYNTDTTSAPVVYLNPNNEKVGYLRRITMLAQMRPCPSKVIRPSFYEVETLEDVPFQYARELKAKGTYDGAIMAKANGVYKVGSGKGGEFLKVKPLLSFTVTVTGAALDFGTKTGKNTAALKFMLDGLEQKVSTGLTQDQVNEITTVGWDGYRIEVEAMGKTVNGYLREPRFRGIRSDA
jgi:ATP-dependent DNA ligase